MQAAFRLGKIPVRVHLSFLILMVVFQAGLLQGRNPQLFLVWVLVVFVSVLIHELGHALMGKAFGLSPEIDLHGMGGTTSWSAGRNLTNGRSILVSLAGPVAGMTFGFAALALSRVVTIPDTLIAQSAYKYFRDVNIGWGVLNLVPMLPLDGGNVMRSTLNAATHGRGEKPSRIISLALALALGVASVAILQDWWFGLLGGLFAYQNFRALKPASAPVAAAPPRDAPFPDAAVKARLDAAYEALEKKDGKRVLALALPMINVSPSDEVRAEALHLAAYGLLLEGRSREADQMISMLPRGYAPHPQYAHLRAQVAG